MPTTESVRGCIVLIDGQPAVEVTRESGETVLYLADRARPATLFRSKGIAERRIAWTRQFAEEKGIADSWNIRHYRIVLVKGEARLQGEKDA
ncbi:MAG: hypothetical protein ACLFWG_00210 [Longimicrobiales bacterium]